MKLGKRLVDTYSCDVCNKEFLSRAECSKHEEKCSICKKEEHKYKHVPAVCKALLAESCGTCFHQFPKGSKCCCSILHVEVDKNCTCKEWRNR